MAGTSPAMTERCNAKSSVHLPEHNLDRSENGGDVSKQMATRKEIHGLQMGESRRADLALVRLVGAIGDQVNAELTLGRLDRGIYFASGHMIALGVKLEMVDQRFHRLLHRAAPRWHDLVVVDRDGPLPGG